MPLVPETRHRGGENTEDRFGRVSVGHRTRPLRHASFARPKAHRFQKNATQRRREHRGPVGRVSIGHRSRRSRSSADRGSRSTSRFRSGSIRPRGALPDRAPQRRGGHRGSFLSASRSAIERRARDHHRRPLSDETEVQNPFGNATCSSRSIQTRPKDPLCPPLLCGAFSGSEPSSAIAHAHAEPEPTPACGSKSKIAGKRDQRYDVQRT